jgi:hypothetical protein
MTNQRRPATRKDALRKQFYYYLLYNQMPAYSCDEDADEDV